MTPAVLTEASPLPEVPEDLRELERELIARGFSVRFPTADEGFRMPAPIKIKGESLGETVKVLRDRPR